MPMRNSSRFITRRNVSVFAIDAYGDLSPEATSDPVGGTAFNGVAISQWTTTYGRRLFVGT